MLFVVGAFSGVVSSGVVFLEEVPIRFVVQEGHSYHIPLLCTPWAYQTYRGS